MLSLLRDAPEGLRAAQVAALLGHPASHRTTETARSVLKTLIERGLAHRASPGLYRAGDAPQGGGS